MIKKMFFNKKEEKGIALPVAVVAMFVLFAIAGAYFISTLNECNKVFSEKAGVGAIETANAGAERAIWFVQQQVDSNPQWQPANHEIELLQTNYDYFKNLSCVDKRKPDKYIQSCVQVGLTSPGTTSPSIGGIGAKVYAVKMRQEDDPTTPEVEWAIYSLGIDRLASPSMLGTSRMDMKVTKIIVRLGTPPLWYDDWVLGDYGENNSTPGQHLHIGGPPLPDGPTVYKSSGWRDNVPVGNAPLTRHEAFTEKRDPPYPPFNPTPEWYDGWQKNSNFKVIMNTPDADTKLQNAIKQGVITQDDITTGVHKPFPNIDLNKFGLPGSGAEIEADYYIDLNNPNPNTDIRDLRHNKHGWTIINNSDGSKTLVQNKQIGLFGKVKDQSLLRPTADALWDENGDGYTVIYIPNTDINIRIYNLMIMPEIEKGGERDVTRAIIVSRGKGQNLFDNADADGRVLLFGGCQYGADMERNSNVGIDIRGEIRPYEFAEEYGAFYDFTWEDATQEMSVRRINYATLTNTSFYTMGKKSGALSLLSENDIIISVPGGDSKDPGDPQSIFRGLVYSKRNVILQEDLLLRGAVIAKESVKFVDQATLWPGLSSWGDGFDIALCHEDAFNSSDGTRGLLPDRIRPRGGGTGRMQIIAWENITGKKIQDTF